MKWNSLQIIEKVERFVANMLKKWRTPPTESNLVVEVSNKLGIGEFQVFQLGYLAWFGIDGKIKDLERIFFVYLKENVLPPWVRHFARKIIQLDRKGELNPNAQQYHRYDVDSLKPVTGHNAVENITFILLFLASVFGLIFIIMFGYAPSEGACAFPYC